MAQNQVSIATYLPAVTFAKALDVIKLVSEGETVVKGCKQLFITVAQFRATCAREPDLQTMLAEAEEMRDDILADMLVDLEELPSDPKMAAIYSKNIQFLLERRRPAKYGRVAENLNPDNEQNRLLAEALRSAVDRIPLPPQAVQAITDATFTVIEPKKSAPAAKPAPKAAQMEETPATHAPVDGLAELKRLGII